MTPKPLRKDSVFCQMISGDLLAPVACDLPDCGLYPRPDHSRYFHAGNLKNVESTLLTPIKVMVVLSGKVMVVFPPDV